MSERRACKMGSDQTMEASMAELAPRKQRKPKRRIMEGQVGGAEVRRIHVIYFLSRKGHIEHPHLLRVHHLSRNGVHLRDVKRWLSELRGKEMPDAFAWSFKRRYKSGYVWQDLLDEDLITPISDNEFVLKGSEISFTRNNSSSRDDDNSLSQKQSTKREISSQQDEEEAEGPRETKMEEHRKSAAFPEMDRESLSFGSEKSTLTDDFSSSSSSLTSSSAKIGEDNRNSHDQFKVETLIHKEREEEEDKTEDHSFLCTSSNGNMEENVTSSTTSDSVSAANTFKRSKSYSSGLFRNLISCGSSDAADSALVAINKRNNKNNGHSGTSADLSLTKGDKSGGSQSQRVFGTTLNRQSQYASRRSFDGVSSPSSKNKTEFNNQKATPPYKPINGPQCSQCGKPFKPEKMHAHMKSCKGMKAMIAKGTRPEISTRGSQRRSSEFAFDSDSPSGFYLMHQQ